jgi:UDP-N-acetylmuramoylalanine--D-glutamate ligase
VHRVAGLPVAVAGNVGTALSGVAGTLPPAATVVLEASSYQLEDTAAFAPECAVLLNVTPDHLDRHGTLAAYRAAKLRIFRNQGNDDVAVAPDDLPGVDDLGGCARRVCFGTRPDSDVVDGAGALWWDGALLLRHDELALRGAHNRRNAMAAAAAALARGVDAGAVREALRTFPGVEHRLEEVATLGGVVFVNDSKATNVESTLVALASFTVPVHLILGGQGKGQDFMPLRAAVAERAATVHLIGVDAGAIGAALAGLDGVPVRRDGDLEHAVAAARAAARAGEVVLLSPACASFDQFADFEDRGRTFRRLVLADG